MEHAKRILPFTCLLTGKVNGMTLETEIKGSAVLSLFKEGGWYYHDLYEVINAKWQHGLFAENGDQISLTKWAECNEHLTQFDYSGIPNDIWPKIVKAVNDAIEQYLQEKEQLPPTYNPEKESCQTQTTH